LSFALTEPRLVKLVMVDGRERIEKCKTKKRERYFTV
jgi:hypothetical protein